MRATSLLAVLLVCTAFAGCSDDPTPPADGGEEEDDGRRSVGGGNPAGGNNTDPPHDVVQIFDAPFPVQGPTSQTFEVTVPANVTVVEATLSWPGPVAERVSYTVTLDGCGSFSDTTVAGSVGGSGSLKGRLCKDAADGKHTLTVDCEGVIPDASIRLVGQLPKANATAA